MNGTLLAMQSRLQQHMLGTGDATVLLAGSAARRALGLAIYAHAYRQRLVDALADAYAKTRAVLGPEDFETSALRYIAEHPPTTRSLRWYGGNFAEHLRAALPEYPNVVELAALDWALRKAFDGPDSAVLESADLAAVAPSAWATLRLTLVPTAELLVFGHNTVAVWQSIDDETPPPAPERGLVGVDWLVWRKGLQPHFRSLHPIEAALLRAMQGGASFAHACEQAQAGSGGGDGGAGDGGEGGGRGEDGGDGALRIGICLRQWLEDGLLSAVVMPAASKA